MRRYFVRMTTAICASTLVCSGTLTLASTQQQQQQQQQQPRTSTTQQQKAAGAQMRQSPAMQAPGANVAGQRPVVMTLVTSTGRLASAPAAFYGLPVSVHAQVGDIVSPGVFTLDEDQWFAGPDVLVVAPGGRQNMEGLDEDDYVTVVGEVRPFVRAELERDFNWFNWGNDLPDVNINFSSRPVIVAEIVRTSDGKEIAPGQKNTTRVFVASPGEIADVPGRFYGRSVSVRGEVEDVRSQRLFTLDEDKLFAGPDLLVLNPYPMVTPDDNDVVTVVGVVRPFVRAEFERDYDWFDANQFGANVDLEDYERRPIVVAHSILGNNNRQFVRIVPAFTLETAERALASRSPRQGDATNERATGTTGRAPSGQQQGRQQQEITDISQILQTNNVNQLMNRTVNLSNVQIQRVEGPRMVWIGQTAERAIPVRIAEAAGAPSQQSLKQGTMVTLRGTIMKPPADATGALASSPYFIHANQFSIDK